MGNKCNCGREREGGYNTCKQCHDDMLRDDYDEYFNTVERACRIPLCFDAWLAAGKYDH